jgi:hypothetical protein
MRTKGVLQRYESIRKIRVLNLYKVQLSRPPGTGSGLKAPMARGVRNRSEILGSRGRFSAIPPKLKINDFLRRIFLTTAGDLFGVVAKLLFGGWDFPIVLLVL